MRTFNFKLSKKEASALKTCIGRQSNNDFKKWGLSKEQCDLLFNLYHDLEKVLKSNE